MGELGSAGTRGWEKIRLGEEDPPLFLFERSEFLIDTPLKKNLRVCPRARVK